MISKVVDQFNQVGSQLLISDEFGLQLRNRLRPSLNPDHATTPGHAASLYLHIRNMILTNSDYLVIPGLLQSMM